MRRWYRLFAAALCCVLLLAAASPSIAGGRKKAHAPRAPQTRVYRVAVLEGGINWVHDKMLAALKAGLAEKGWANRVEFPANAHEISSWTTMGRAGTRRMAADLMQRKDIDLIIAMGTDPAQELLACNNGRTPIVAMTVSDPIGSGIIKNERDSGVDNLTTAIAPDQWLNMLRLFHTVVGFKRLGVLYEDTPAGRTYTNLDDVRDAVREKGTALEEFPHLQSGASMRECLAGLEWLVSRHVDAVYLPDIPCFDWTLSDPRPLLNYLRQHRVATFAHTGMPMVQLGALMGAYDFDLKPLGRFHAAQLISIFQGVQPRRLKMVVPNAMGLSLNLKTARMMGRDLSPDVLVSADVIVSRDLKLEDVRKER